MRILTVLWFGAQTRRTGPTMLARCGDFVSLLRMRLIEKMTDCAVNGVPSWNVTPLRSRSVMSFPFFETEYERARPGTISPLFGFRNSNVS